MVSNEFIHIESPRYPGRFVRRALTTAVLSEASEEYIQHLHIESQQAVTSAYNILVEELDMVAKDRPHASGRDDVEAPPSNQEMSVVKDTPRPGPCTDAARLEEVVRQQRAFRFDKEQETLNKRIKNFSGFLDDQEKHLNQLQKKWQHVSIELKAAILELRGEKLTQDEQEEENGFLAQMEALRKEAEILGDEEMETLRKSEKAVKKKWKTMGDMFMKTFVDDFDA